MKQQFQNQYSTKSSSEKMFLGIIAFLILILILGGFAFYSMSSYKSTPPIVVQTTTTAPPKPVQTTTAPPKPVQTTTAPPKPVQTTTAPPKPVQTNSLIWDNNKQKFPITNTAIDFIEKNRRINKSAVFVDSSDASIKWMADDENYLSSDGAIIEKIPEGRDGYCVYTVAPNTKMTISSNGKNMIINNENTNSNTEGIFSLVDFCDKVDSFFGSAISCGSLKFKISKI
jgi:hypothetical protein